MSTYTLNDGLIKIIIDKDQWGDQRVRILKFDYADESYRTVMENLNEEKSEEEWFIVCVDWLKRNYPDLFIYGK